jgi:nitroimidazol reductase NimA-like FMN-containing flavoprotein (pyridoxamine 5'-phosphate oxidase superfamily)
MHKPPPSARTTVRRLPERGDYDPATIRAILDEGLVCHVGFVVDGQPFVIPMGYGRDGDHLILHGSVASRMLRGVAGGAPICATVTLLDGLVIARSVFHHSMNYRSVVIVGRPELIEDPVAKMRALERLTEHLVPGRWAEARGPNDRELAKTQVLRLSLQEASAKIRTGPPKDDEEDYALPIWAGVLPYSPAAGTPEPDPRLPRGIEPPPYVTSYRRRRG